MTNNYDAQDLDQQAAYRGSMRAPMAVEAEATAIRSRLIANLKASVEECQNLETFYSNLGHQLGLCVSQVETKR